MPEDVEAPAVTYAQETPPSHVGTHATLADADSSKKAPTRERKRSSAISAVSSASHFVRQLSKPLVGLKRRNSYSESVSASLARASSVAARAHQKIIRALISAGTVGLSFTLITALIYFMTGSPPAGVAAMGAPLGALLLLLAVPINNGVQVRTTAGLWAFFTTVMGLVLVNNVRKRLACFSDGVSPKLECVGWVGFSSAVSIATISSGIFTLLTLRRKDGLFVFQPRITLKRVWSSIRLTLFATGISFLIFFSIVAIANKEFARSVDFYAFLVAGAWFILVVLWATPRRRGRFLNRVSNFFAGPDAKAASAIASMIGGAGSDKLLEAARADFAGLPYKALTAKDLESNADSGLPARTEKLELGAVDAFMSHSWHDDADKKWEALRGWAERFAATHEGRMPSLWLDKACIDQTRITDQVALLPVYVSGCRTFLALVGPTYHQRLWCIIELYTFLAISGVDPTAARVLSKVTFEPTGIDETGGTAGFRLLKTDCTDQSLRQRLLGIVERSYPDLDEFNRYMQGVLTRRDEDVMEDAKARRGSAAKLNDGSIEDGGGGSVEGVTSGTTTTSIFSNSADVSKTVTV